MAAYIGGVFFVTMVLAAIIMDLVFTALGWVPGLNADVRVHINHFSFGYTFWLNLTFGALATYLFTVSRKIPMSHDHAAHEHGNGAGGTGARHDHAAHHPGWSFP